MAKPQVLKDYPNLENRQLASFIGCLSEMEKNKVREGFTRVCFKDVKIVEIEPIRNNCVPTCVWRVYYQLKDPNIEFSGIPPSLPEDEPSLEKLFNDITAMRICIGMKVVGKHHTHNRSYAIVEYQSNVLSVSMSGF